MRTIKTERPAEILPWEPPVELSTGELIVYHADRLTNEVQDALEDGHITIWEGLKLGLSLIGGVVQVVRGKRK